MKSKMRLLWLLLLMDCVVAQQMPKTTAALEGNDPLLIPLRTLIITLLSLYRTALLLTALACAAYVAVRHVLLGRVPWCSANAKITWASAVALVVLILMLAPVGSSQHVLAALHNCPTLLDAATTNSSNGNACVTPGLWLFRSGHLLATLQAAAPHISIALAGWLLLAAVPASLFQRQKYLGAAHPSETSLLHFNKYDNDDDDDSDNDDAHTILGWPRYSSRHRPSPPTQQSAAYASMPASSMPYKTALVTTDHLQPAVMGAVVASATVQPSKSSWRQQTGKVSLLPTPYDNSNYPAPPPPPVHHLYTIPENETLPGVSTSPHAQHMSYVPSEPSDAHYTIAPSSRQSGVIIDQDQQHLASFNGRKYSLPISPVRTDDSLHTVDDETVWAAYSLPQDTHLPASQRHNDLVTIQAPIETYYILDELEQPTSARNA